MKKLIPLTFATALILGGVVSPASASSPRYDDYQAGNGNYSDQQDESNYIHNRVNHYRSHQPKINQEPQDFVVVPDTTTAPAPQANPAPQDSAAAAPDVSTPAPTQPAPTNSSVSKADGIVNYALSLVGKARYGHTNPSTLTFDCSGFTYYVFQKYGVDLHSRSPQGQAKVGVAVSKSQLQKGDLVFFNNSHKPLGHVGIYIGNNKIVHAANSQSDIKVSDLNGSWYQQNYATARRVL
jgi:cell wall-associated NlpC family hydrolase